MEGPVPSLTFRRGCFLDAAPPPTRYVVHSNASSSDADACGSAYHNLSECDFPLSPQLNCTGTYMDVQPVPYLCVCGILFGVATLVLGHLGYRISLLQYLDLPKARTRFPLSLYIMSVVFCVIVTFRSIDVFGYAGAWRER
jgi:hypothetical protein